MNEATRNRKAFEILGQYYEQIVERAADAILEKEESIGTSYLGHGEEIVERYGHQLLLTGQVLGGLRAVGERKAVRKPVPTKVTSFVCPEAEVEERLRAWFEVHAAVLPVSVQVLAVAEGFRCLVVYREEV